jgi:uncharacterized protein YlxW (UPF0749 family)
MKRWLFPVTGICMLTGVLIAVQFRAQVHVRNGGPGQRVEDLAFLLKTTEKSNTALADQVADLQGRLRGNGALIPIGARHGKPQYPAVEGPGIEVFVQDSAASPSEDSMGSDTSAVVHAEDLLKLVNELHSGGAEAISLNGHRLTETSEIITAGQHTLVDEAPVNSPYTLWAIGPAGQMKDTLLLRGGVTEYLQFYGIRVKILSVKQLTLPAADRPGGYKFAKPAPAEPPETYNAAPLG